ncbi:hypothetical protein [Microbacterium sp.]|uniref:hypothetical protein n=1 Tax=Microbacterium sp. TaxID=51671 RepID=UPI002638846D|nr:hypothetical protein [Microbacterium sp.]
MIEVAASLWSVPAENQLATALRLRDAGVRRLHWDATDGRFAAAGGFSPTRAAELAVATGMTAEAHIMAEQSTKDVDAWTEFCDLVIVHAESTDWQAAVTRIENRGCRAGLAVSPQTPASVVPAGMTALCMSIVPGAAGSTFDDTVLGKVAELRAGDSDRSIGIDGGVQRRHAEDAADAGANWLAVGTDLVFDGEPAWADLLRAAV